jgi:FlaA1/EpsC-like NDP-sugar epimerase
MSDKDYAIKPGKHAKKSDFQTKLSKILKNKKILVSGGAGSIGFVLVKKLLEYPVHSIRVLDINEHALFELKHEVNDPRLRLLLGNILDKDRIEMAGNKADIIFHAAAIKNIEISEYNPIETIDTNVNGTVNMIKMAIRNKVKIFLNISTDKAADASTLYGTTKQLTERLISWASIHTAETKFASVRFGNVMDSRGNVFEVWEKELKNKKPLSITHPLVERYMFNANEATGFILKCLTVLKTGEIFVPKMKSYKIKDLAQKYSKKQKIVGLRQGEKLKEILITEDERKKCLEKKDMWIISPYNNQ